MRPDSWNFPLLLHVAGAAVLFGAVAAAAVSTLAADRVPEPEFMRRLAFRSLLIVGLPAYIVMRIGAEWLYSKGFDELEDDPAWLGIGYIVADVGLLVFVHRARARRSRGVEAEQRGRQGSGRPQHRAPRRDDRRRLGDGREAQLSLPAGLASARHRSSASGAPRIRVGAEQHEPRLLHCRLRLAHPRKRLPKRVLERPAVGARRDEREGDRRRAELVRDRERPRVARPQRRALVVSRRRTPGRRCGSPSARRARPRSSRPPRRRAGRRDSGSRAAHGTRRGSQARPSGGSPRRHRRPRGARSSRR